MRVERATDVGERNNVRSLTTYDRPGEMRNDPTRKTEMALALARKQIAKIAADLLSLATREQNREMASLARHACEKVEAIQDDLRGGLLDPERAIDEAIKVFERLSEARARMVATD
jgi:hypothetical protein